MYSWGGYGWDRGFGSTSWLGSIPVGFCIPLGPAEVGFRVYSGLTPPWFGSGKDCGWKLGVGPC